MIIKKAEYTISSPRESMCPKDTKPEFAFIGRSNVGKSSLINMLTNRKALAKTSSKPGKTLLINHFIINNEWYLVDLPGYGYAKLNREGRDELKAVISDYINNSEELICLFVLIDSRHDIGKIDLDFIRELGEHGVPFSIIFTKTDKIGPNVLKAQVERDCAILSEEWEQLPEMFLSSSQAKKGRDEILTYIENILKTL